MNGLGRISFIISLSLTLLISGVILFYCVNRFKHLETNIIEQGKILQSFIITAENQKCNLYSNIALESAKQQVNKFSNINKIEVSDDEYDGCSNKKMSKKNADADDENDENDDDDDDDDDDEENDDDDDDEDEDNEDDEDDDEDEDDASIKKKSSDHFNAFKNILCGQLENYDNTSIKPINIVKNNRNEIIDVIAITGIIDMNEMTEMTEMNNIPDVIEVTDLTDLTDVTEVTDVTDVTEVTDAAVVTKVAATTETQVNKAKKLNFNRLKLQELKELVLEKNPDLKNNISNIKKEELIKILNKN
jgi:cobalamin biosynthesis protein CobT